MLVLKGTNNKWTYNLTGHLMIDLERIISIPSLTCTVDLDAYEEHPGNEKFSTTLLMNARILHYTYDRGSLLFNIILVYLC